MGAVCGGSIPSALNKNIINFWMDAWEAENGGIANPLNGFVRSVGSNPTPSAIMNEKEKGVQMIYGTYIPPFAGYKPKPLKWYQKIWYSIYNTRDEIAIITILLIWVGGIVFIGMKGYGRYIPAAVIPGLITGVMAGIGGGHYYPTYRRR